MGGTQGGELVRVGEPEDDAIADPDRFAAADRRRRKPRRTGHRLGRLRRRDLVGHGTGRAELDLSGTRGSGEQEERQPTTDGSGHAATIPEEAARIHGENFTGKRSAPGIDGPHHHPRSSPASRPWTSFRKVAIASSGQAFRYMSYFR